MWTFICGAEGRTGWAKEVTNVHNFGRYTGNLLLEVRPTCYDIVSKMVSRAIVI